MEEDGALLRLIHQHLLLHGHHEAARALKKRVSKTTDTKQPAGAPEAPGAEGAPCPSEEAPCLGESPASDQEEEETQPQEEEMEASDSLAEPLCGQEANQEEVLAGSAVQEVPPTKPADEPVTSTTGVDPVASPPEVDLQEAKKKRKNATKAPEKEETVCLLLSHLTGDCLSAAPVSPHRRL
ncbi:hypothetical protein NHX12_004079, partial [Muraenolepis orangiensis]